MTVTPIPLVYSCSGCSNVAQLANTLAVRLDRAGLAEMSCIAGVGGRVAALVKKANSGRPILAIDGCPMHCARACLAQHGVMPDVHITLSSWAPLKTHIRAEPGCESAAPWHPNADLGARRAS